jgi:hypothetical protein
MSEADAVLVERDGPVTPKCERDAISGFSSR